MLQAHASRAYRGADDCSELATPRIWYEVTNVIRIRCYWIYNDSDAIEYVIIPNCKRNESM